ncbi:MAG: acyl-CoA/acyl-ACP dehydrogenase [Rhodospirillum sp.]|nr:acyl-CoA/acyl-ACP dehydrogenase [Rhodospirillum sp.]MCF8490571.1 acyl-CoA/acyl-ACP dehydrogenase [Rhodospirillum sp.]MCF8502116.1 acyl-CoA/acyl-ACP dehydrogenase [Rhodospirillum sp.]
MDPHAMTLHGQAEAAATAARDFVDRASARAASELAVDGRIPTDRSMRWQRRIHGLAWAATVAQALIGLAAWMNRSAGSEGGEVSELVLRIGMGEYLQQLVGGIPMGPNEIVRPTDLGIGEEVAAFAANPDVALFLREGNTVDNRANLMGRLIQGASIPDGLGDGDLDMARDQFRRFTDDKIVPDAHRWHLEDRLIPGELIAEMAEFGVFGVCIPEVHGGLGLGKLAMCVVTEELSRGWIAAGSLGTRSEIAGELIATAGTPAQKEEWLGPIAAGEVLPAAVFTEPDIGSDLAHLRTRATRTADGWRIHGAKTWITHAARADLMTVLARTAPDTPGHDGLSMFLAAKDRGTDEIPFPVEGLHGSEIPVLGYRGMKEYQLSFDGFQVPADGLLGGREGQGFAQLMRTFEGARIQTAARAVGVARRAWELGFQYALDRHQFGSALAAFPRVADKLVLAIVETVMARELTYFAAREKDTGRRCDVEAGMAKLLAARVAWTNADASLQIHGGNGYALEFEISRVLCDARILNIFEGAAEIQAQVIGRGLVSAALRSPAV